MGMSVDNWCQRRRRWKKKDRFSRDWSDGIAFESGLGVTLVGTGHFAGVERNG